MWWKVIVVVLVVLAFVITVAILYGTNRWQSDTRELHAKMEAARVLITPKSYDPHELEGLPAPVQRYFRAVLKEGQPLVAAVSVEHNGSRSSRLSASSPSVQVLSGMLAFAWRRQ